MKPMLLQEIERYDRMHDFLADSEFWLEQKIDGRRLLVDVDDVVTFYNRNGDVASVLHEQEFFSEMREQGRFIFDGELAGDTYWVFDLPSAKRPDGGALITPSDPLEVRRAGLELLFSAWDFPPSIRLLPRKRDFAEKGPWFRTLNLMGAEGVVFKHASSAYTPGRRNPLTIKVKFVKEIDAVVMDHPAEGGSESVTVGVLNDGTLVPVGRCSVVGKDLPPLWSVVEVRFLYATRPAGHDLARLYQPRIIRARDDKLADDCTYDQLEGKFANKTVLS